MVSMTLVHSVPSSVRILRFNGRTRALTTSLRGDRFARASGLRGCALTRTGLFIRGKECLLSSVHWRYICVGGGISIVPLRRAEFGIPGCTAEGATSGRKVRCDVRIGGTVVRCADSMGALIDVSCSSAGSDNPLGQPCTGVTSSAEWGVVRALFVPDSGQLPTGSWILSVGPRLAGTVGENCGGIGLAATDECSAGHSGSVGGEATDTGAPGTLAKLSPPLCGLLLDHSVPEFFAGAAELESRNKTKHKAITASSIPPAATWGGIVDQNRAAALPVKRCSLAPEDFPEPPSTRLCRVLRVDDCERVAVLSNGVESGESSRTASTFSSGSVPRFGRETSGMRNSTGNSLLS